MIYFTPSAIPSSSGIMIRMQETNFYPNGRPNYDWGFWSN